MEMAANARADVASLAEDFAAALIAGDAQLADLIALDAVGQGVDVPTLYVDVMAPALREIGSLWERGGLTVADEHLATSIALSVMRHTGPAARRAPARSRARITLAGIGGEGHVVGLRMIADLAEGAGFDVHFLGPAVPVAALSGAVRRHRPALVGLSVTMAASVGELDAAIGAVAEHGVPLLVGGAGVPDTLRDDPAVHHAADARGALALIERLVG
jgi:MerR family transcriptional regulator, light-induced transcriptional regulator